MNSVVYMYMGKWWQTKDAAVQVNLIAEESFWLIDLKDI